jgi:hypothetical protein
MIDFRTQKSCMRCQWHSMHENCLLGSPFKFTYFFSGGVGQFGNIYVFDRYSFQRLPGPFESFVDRACGVIDTACIFNFFCIPSLFCIWFSLFEVVLKIFCACRMRFKKFEYLREFEFIFEKEPPSPDVLMKKNRGSKISWHCPFKQIFMAVELAPPSPSPSPSQGCAGGGVVVALFSHKQWLWLWLWSSED